MITFERQSDTNAFSSDLMNDIFFDMRQNMCQLIRCQDKGAKLIYKMKDNDKTLTDKVTDVIFGGKPTKKM